MLKDLSLWYWKLTRTFVDIWPMLMERPIYFPKVKCLGIQIQFLQRRKKKLDDDAIRAIIMDSRSFGDFRRVGMQSFLKIATPGYKGPAARTVQRNLKNLYDEKKVQFVSITADTWRSGRKRQYLCVTAHFVSLNYEQHGTIVSFRQFYGRSFAKRIRRHIRTVLGMYGLEHGKVYVTTTDNGSDVRKATQYMDVFGIRLHCIAHGLNLVIQKSLNLWPRMEFYGKW